MPAAMGFQPTMLARSIRHLKRSERTGIINTRPPIEYLEMQTTLTILLAVLALIGITAPSLIVGTLTTSSGLATEAALALVVMIAIGLVSAGVTIYRLK